MKMSIRRAKMAPATFALLRKACIMGTLAAPNRKTKRGSVVELTQNLKARCRLAVDTGARDRYSHQTPPLVQSDGVPPPIQTCNSGNRMALSEIEKLERRYAENPHGLTFAPLAEVHRKNGEVQRALDLLKPGLQNHPDYIPASIVLGRCHLDLGDLPAAETAFTHVLDLDGENVIALKALADINERLHRFDDAERWLNTLLTLDRSNDEARDQLARLEVARRSTATGAAAAGGDATAGDLTAESGGPPEGTEISAEASTAGWRSQPDAPAVADATPLMLE